MKRYIYITSFFIGLFFISAFAFGQDRGTPQPTVSKPQVKASLLPEPCSAILTPDADIIYKGVPSNLLKVLSDSVNGNSNKKDPTPMASTVIMSENFDSYAGFNTNGTIPAAPWSRNPNAACGTTNTWGNDYANNYITPNSGVNYMWCRGMCYNSLASYYANNMNAWLIYGPFDLTNTNDADLDFYKAYSTESGFDYGYWYASIDGTNYYGYSVSGGPLTPAWTAQNFNLTAVPTIGNLCGQANVWIAFRFSSDGSAVDDGYYIDDVVLTKTPSCITPTTQASNITFSGSPNCTQLTVNWTNGNGTKRIVKCNTSNSFTNPVNGTDPGVTNPYTSGEQVVYNGTGNSVTVTGLVAGTTYWFRVYEASCSGASILFQTSTASNNPLSQATSPPAPATPGAISGLTPQCPNLAGQVYSISAVTNATTYTWAVPGGAWVITGGQGTTAVTVTTGNVGDNGNITVTAGNSCGTSSASSFAVTVAAASTPYAGPDQYICSTTGTATMAATGTGTWSQISGPGVAGLPSTNANITLTLAGSGTYVFRWSACGGVYDDVVIVRQ